MVKNMWLPLLQTLEVQGKLCPCTTEDLDAYERERDFKLPKSYREFAVLFGPGMIGWLTTIAVPRTSAPHSVCELRALQDRLRVRHEVVEPCPNFDQIRRGVFFGHEEGDANFFWDPAVVTDARNSECGIFMDSRSGKFYRLADSFWDFVHKNCLDICIPETFRWAYVHGETEEEVELPPKKFFAYY